MTTDRLLSGRVLIVSNRLPVTARLDDGVVRLELASGGLATGLRRWHSASNGRWIGWPGDLDGLDPDQRAELALQFEHGGIVPVHLTHDCVERFYHGFANRVLWPLFHYLIDRVPVDAAGWAAYREANQAFADIVAREYRKDDTIWVHDYQLMLLPALLRERLPRARIGFFLHVPFPSSEVFRVLPWRRDVLRGLLGADLIGFHTFAYMRHFLAALLHVEGVEADIDRVRLDGHESRLGVFPMGIDATQFAELAQDEEIRAEAEALRRDAGGRQIVLGVDRLDYTKGIPRRLASVERLIEREPALADRIRYIQVAVPSRGEVDSYQRFKRLVEESVGRINGACGTARSSPIHYMHQSVSVRQLVALYCAADVMLVTPLRDGMNLVAKEFIASRVDDDGVLVLSEFAGAAAELDGALVVNPYDVDAVATSLGRALSMAPDERRTRMKAQRRRVGEHDVHRWAESFLATLGDARHAELDRTDEPQIDDTLIGALILARRAPHRRLLLDYDGTLVPLARSPELAVPDEELLTLLADLTASPGVHIDIVSGRPRDVLEQWFGGLRVGLWAEHGFWSRAMPEETWQPAAIIPHNWPERIYPILEQFTRNTAGSEIEIKSASLAWHYRRAHREFGARQAHELRMLLGDALSNQPWEVLEGKKVIEIRLRGVSKAAVVQRVLADAAHGAAIVAIGDDRTDEDLFHALPAGSLTVAVGTRPSHARFRVEDHRAVRRVLKSLLKPSGGRGAAEGVNGDRHADPFGREMRVR